MDMNFLLALGTTLVAAAAYITSTAVLANLTRRDFKDFKNEVNGKFAAMDAKFENKFAVMDAKFENKFAVMEAKFENKFAAMEAKFESRFSLVENRFSLVENRFSLVENRLDSLEKDVSVIRAICEERYKK